MGSPSSFGRKRPFISLNSSASIENLSRSERAHARTRFNHAIIINDAQKGCAMQLNGITLIGKLLMKRECLGPGAHFSKVPVTFQAWSNTLKSKSLERWHSFQSAIRPTCFINFEFYWRPEKLLGLSRNGPLKVCRT